jgi:hypothetical protein
MEASEDRLAVHSVKEDQCALIKSMSGGRCLKNFGDSFFLPSDMEASEISITVSLPNVEFPTPLVTLSTLTTAVLEEVMKVRFSAKA